MTKAYYNEIDPDAAQWLRNLIAAGHIAPGDVDERSIEDVLPTDLVGYTQCHFFAGIGIWSYALRLAGWPDDRPVWTGSCPCQPFSTAGKGDGTADERHLWPAWFHLIEHGKAPDVPVFGEQVANGGGFTWLDLVWADLEGARYAFRAVDLCAAGVGAPHIRQRLFFHAFRPAARVGDTGRPGLQGHRGYGYDRDEPGRIGAEPLGSIAQAGASDGLADTGHNQLGGRDAIRCAEGEHGCAPCEGEGTGAERQRPEHDAAVRSPGCWLADGEGSGARLRDCEPREERRHELADHGSDERMADAECVGIRGEGLGQDGGAKDGVQGENRERERIRVDTWPSCAAMDETRRPGPVNGRWAAADWLWCRDQKWRPVEPGTQPLVDGAPSRVVRLRAYGNGIVSEVAAEFIKAVM